MFWLCCAIIFVTVLLIYTLTNTLTHTNQHENLADRSMRSDMSHMCALPRTKITQIKQPAGTRTPPMKVIVLQHQKLFARTIKNVTSLVVSILRNALGDGN